MNPNYCGVSVTMGSAERVGFEPTVALSNDTRFQVAPINPL